MKGLQGFSRRHFLAGLAGSALLATSLRGETSRAAGAVPAVGDDGLRRLFGLYPDLTYLNNGSLGPCPSVVLERTHAAWLRLERNPVLEGYGPLLQEAESVRKQAAAFLGVGVDELAITRNTTEAMNLIAQGIELREGDRVLTTDQEHPGGSLCWQYYARRRGVGIDVVGLDPGRDDAAGLVARFKAAITPQTRVMSVSHVTYTTGQRLPIPSLAALAHEHGMLCVVDGAQAPGGLAVDVAALGCDAYATSAHKWLLAPKGTGLLVIRQAARKRIDPLPLSSGMRVYTGATGEQNIPGVIGLGAALEFLGQLNMAEVEKHNMALRGQLLEAVSNLPVTLVSPVAAADGAPIVSLGLPPGIDAGKIQQTLSREHRIEVRAVQHGTLQALRVSLHVYNTRSDIDRFIRALAKMQTGNGRTIR